MSPSNDAVPIVRGESDLRLLDSCSFTWLFDERRRLFRRVPRGASFDIPVPAEAWIPYHRLEVNDSRSSFTVVTDAGGTLVFRCWLHRDPCPRCQSTEGPTLGIDELRSLVQWWKTRIGIVEAHEPDAPVSIGRLRVRTGPRRNHAAGDVDTEG